MTKSRKIAAVSAMLTAVGIACYAHSFGSEDIAIVTVTHKERVMSAEGSYYLVFGEDETFAVEDNWIRGSWAASDLFGKLRDGGTYTVRVVGWRIPALSAYRNIIAVEGDE